ncbi:MAG: ATP-binding protein [Gemmatimonas sp.]
MNNNRARDVPTTGEARAATGGTLRRTMFMATVLMVLYGLSFPSLVLWRLVPPARMLEDESVATSDAFQTLREQGDVFQGAVSLARALNDRSIKDSSVIVKLLADTVQAMRDAPVLEYGEVAEEMRNAFASLVAQTDQFTATLDEAGRAFRLGEDSIYRARLRTALDSVSGIAQSLDEAQRQGLGDLLDRQARVNKASSELVSWTVGWLVVGGFLMWYLVTLTRRRLIVPLRGLEHGLTQLSAGDLEARISESDDELGRVANVFNRASDVLRRRAEEQGRFAAAGQLLADVAHEVNNPLMAILGTAEANLVSSDLKAETRADFELVREQARRAGQLLSGLLRFVRVGDEPVEIVQLSAVVTRAIDLVAYQFPLHSIECVRKFSPETSPVRTAATRLEQVFVNLLTNAVQAMAKLPGRRKIEVRVWQNGSWSCVSVQDNGPGVSADFRDRLFQPFSSTKGSSGTGLGLYICRRIAREGGGDLTYTDANPGAQFLLTLPACEPDAVPTPTPVPRVVQADGGLLAGINVLIVDDEDGVRTAIARYLRRSGASVREAIHGRDALTQVDAERPDVVLLDLRMPVMDGYAFMAEVREGRLWLEPRVLVLSGDLGAGHTGNTPVPPARMMAKPVVLQDLVKRLKDVAQANAQ